MLLATDLDGTFLAGDLPYRQKLYTIISQQPALKLVFVTGRGVESILPLFEHELPVPRPDYIICDVGATILHGNTLSPVDALQLPIDARWVGKEKVLQAVAGIHGLEPQQVPQQRRCSFFFNGNTDMGSLRQAVRDIECDLIISAGKFADVLPGGVNKGSTLKALVNYLELSSNEVLTAGDTFNDLSLFNAGYKGVVVGNAEEGLLKATANREYVYQAKTEGTEGILEAMHYFPSFRKWVRDEM
ncbi:MAG: HAD hydrolase family protein [Chitinophagaceae bacterium]|nr:HAD hydrolase family protein [Chitinophagaceae bacterium]